MMCATEHYAIFGLSQSQGRGPRGGEGGHMAPGGRTCGNDDELICTHLLRVSER